MFIKNGDGKILSVIESDELDEKQKKAVKNLSEQIVKSEADTNSAKKLEN
ncbi:MAG TPA: hypothetical protein VNW06_09285 [Cytophagaceae bacterium]|jgi:hypothetical protein|nr:hypothetical protein [Cytophagaceae bacterium]